ncbi:I78 family peptidase inhibitor [Dinoroseobacter sp. S124A]|uniref:I78 family peptidase inhibitor n=1 Tax=Dinoroseobacter sp. S124A TaxID=3415128 RepID=UPI003C7A0961
MLRAFVVGLWVSLLALVPPGSAEAQSGLREDVFDIQTALNFYGFVPGPVDGVVGPATERGLDALGRYLKLGPVNASAMEGPPLPPALRALMDAFEARNGVYGDELEPKDQERLRREGERFWIRKALQPDLETWGVTTPRDADTCGAWDNEGLIGQPIDPNSTLVPRGAGSVRVIYFGPVTMDFRPDRLNIRIDPWNDVTNLSCG